MKQLIIHTKHGNFSEFMPLRLHLLAFQASYSKLWSGGHQVCRTCSAAPACIHQKIHSMQVVKKSLKKTYSGKIVRHILRNVATEFESLKPGEEHPREAPYREELREIAKDLEFESSTPGEEHPGETPYGRVNELCKDLEICGYYECEAK